MNYEVATPQHDKLLAEPELEAAVARIYEWMSTRGKKSNGTGSTERVAICRYTSARRAEKVYCRDCEGTGKDITKLSQRQQQVVRHMRLLKESPPLGYKQEDKTERDEALKELDTFVNELDKCDSCYGEGEATVYVDAGMEWRPSFATPRELLCAMLGVDAGALRVETQELFAHLKAMADERPRTVSAELDELEETRARRRERDDRANHAD